MERRARCAPNDPGRHAPLGRNADTALTERGGQALLDALGGEPMNPDQLASRSLCAAHPVAIALGELKQAGWIERAQGAIWPRLRRVIRR